MVEKNEKIKGGYISLFVIIFMAVFFTSYTVFQWREGGPTVAAATGSGSGCSDGVLFGEGVITGSPTPARCVATASGVTAGAQTTCSGTQITGTSASVDADTGICDAAMHQGQTGFCEYAPAAEGTTSSGEGTRVSCVRGTNDRCYIPSATALSAAAASSGTDIPNETEASVALGGGCDPATPTTDCAECNPPYLTETVGTPGTKACRFWLPGSNQFDMKEYKFFRFIYFFTLIILAACISNKLKGGNENIMYVIIAMPFWVPIITEIFSGILDYTKDDSTDGSGDTPATPRTTAHISPELLLIHFMRGDSAGIRPSDANQNLGAEGPTGGRATRTTTQEPDWLSRKANTSDGIAAGQPTHIDPFFSTHFFFTMIFYLLLMTLMIIHSQGLYGIQESNAPLYITLILMVGFPFIMTYIFVQDAAYDSINDEIPLPQGVTLEQSASEREALRDARYGLWCKIEKYGGIQTMLCISLIIMILCKTNTQQNKAVALILIILLTYGFSQTLEEVRAY